MVTYKLVATNNFNKKRVVLEEKNVAKLDYFTFENFSNNYDLSSYFNVDDSNFHIQYRYNNNIKYLDVIYKNNDKIYFELLQSCKKNKIDINLSVFNEYLYYAMKMLNDRKLKYLFDKKYIDRKTYNDFYSYKHMSENSYDYNRDRKEIYYEIKKDLEKYINFRKLYSGLLKPECPIINDKIIQYHEAKTDDERLNSLFENGGLDAVYAEYDLDDLDLINGNHTLNIDGISYKKIL